MLNHLERESSISNKVIGIPVPRIRRRSDRASLRRHYEKRKAAGVCAYFGCSSKPVIDHKHCQKHLDRMSKDNKKLRKARKEQALCIYCGELPQFWGVRCIICRQRFTKNLLPVGARRALRLYRDAERQLELELLQAHARFRIRTLLTTGDVTGKRARALRLYAGLDTGQWRTYEEVGRLMHVTKQRVHKLLKPSKIILSDSLGYNAP